jgi:hypothetical protein
MNMLNRFGKKLSRVSLVALCGLYGLPANAVVLDIKAVFAPDSAVPHKNEFVNKTPSQGFCAQVPSACKPEGLFSLIVPIAFTANAPIRANHTDPRQGGMTKVPSEWRDVLVTHSSGETDTVKIRIAAIGHVSQLPVSISQLTGATGQPGWNRLWQGGAWMYAPSPCQGVGWSIVGLYDYNSFWKVPLGAGVCSKQALFDIPIPFRYQYFVLGYQLITPNPLGMKSGPYAGPISFSVGPGKDFDMGDVMEPNDETLTLNLTLDVQHTLKVDIPPGGNRVELVPQGGWQSWLQQGRKPTRLFRDQTFTISASSRFKMQLECQYSWDGNACYVLDPVSGHAVPANISVSLPHGLTDAGGQPVNRRPLLRDGSGTKLFQPGFYVDRKPGALHFEIPPSEVAEMIQPGAARNYAGNVTVIWDSDV